MKKRVFFLALLLVCAMPVVAFAAAPDRVGHLDIGVSGGGAFNDGNVDDSGYVQTALSWGVFPWLGIGVEGAWQEADGASDETVGRADVLADFIFRAPTPNVLGEDIVPYGIVGLGAQGQWVEDSDGVAPNNNGDDVDDTVFAWKLGLGADWFFNPNWALNVELSWIFADPDLPGSSVDGDGDSFNIGGGIKYVF